MSATALPTPSARAASKRRQQLLGSVFVNVVLGLICLLWTIPTFGLLISSFRPQEDINSSGWWAVFPHREFATTQTIELPRDVALDKPIALPGLNASVTDEQLQSGTTLPSGQRVQWESRRRRTVAVQASVVKADTNFTFENYRSVLTGQARQTDGSVKSDAGTNFANPFLNSVSVAIPGCERRAVARCLSVRHCTHGGRGRVLGRARVGVSPHPCSRRDGASMDP